MPAVAISTRAIAAAEAGQARAGSGYRDAAYADPAMSDRHDSFVLVRTALADGRAVTGRHDRRVLV